MSLELKTELFMAIENYESTESEKRENGIDIKALDNESNDKVLLRVITKPESRTGYVGANIIDEMVESIKNGNFDKGVLIGSRFTEAAKKRLEDEGIQRISDSFILNYSPERLFLATRDLVNSLCKSKCGKIPSKESDCKGHNDDSYSCEVRLISDNASYHFERGWTRLLQKDVFKLLSIHA